VRVETQKAASERPERPVPTNRDRIQHQVVEAHGATKVDYTPDQHTRKHEQGVFESKGESGKREVKKGGATLGRHVTSKPGAEVSADRAKEVKSVRV
jgi:hypothetical protein